MVHATNSKTNTPFNGVPTACATSKQRQEFPTVEEAEIGREVAVSTDDESTLARRSPGFSLFKWLKRSNRGSIIIDKKKKRDKESTDGFTDNPDESCSVCSSNDSSNTIFSTTTVHSFAYHSGSSREHNGFSFDALTQGPEVGPFGTGASKIVDRTNDLATDANCTLPIVYSQKRDIGTRYSLQSFGFNSCDNVSDSKKLHGRSSTNVDERVTRSAGGSARKRVHVKGKRRAPNPPGPRTRSVKVNATACETSRSSSRRKGPAPPPPYKYLQGDRTPDAKEQLVRIVESEGMDVTCKSDIGSLQTISNDTLVLQGGVLLSKRERQQLSDPAAALRVEVQCTRSQTSLSTSTMTNAMPRPWYKRSVFEHSRDAGPSKRADILKNLPSSETREECSQVGAGGSNESTTHATLSRLNFFHRGERHAEDKRKDAKRKSGLTILTNISELDKEAAAIVQEEQAKGRASMLLHCSRASADADRPVSEEIVQDMVTSAMESSPRRGTRALISKFNAIGNITKVTVNASFFARSGSNKGQQAARFDISRNNPYEHSEERLGQAKLSMRNSTGQNVRVEKDISRYFFPQLRTENSKGRSSSGLDEVAETKRRGDRDIASRDRKVDVTKQTTTRILPIRPSTIAIDKDERVGSNENVELTKEDKVETPAGSCFPESRTTVVEVGKNESTRVDENLEPTFASKELETIQKEFSDIFDEIDKQLRSQDLKLSEQPLATAREEATNVKNTGHDIEASTLSELAKASNDTMTEKGKSEKLNIVAQSTSKMLSDTSAEARGKEKSNKVKIITLNTVEDPVTVDLKEMLKEMKHSLPKRPKPRNVSSKASTQTESIVTKNAASNLVKPTFEVNLRELRIKDKPMILLGEHREWDRQKVSSAAQTSGNVRRISPTETPSDRTSKLGWKRENVLYTATGKKVASTGLVKNTFQLIRPRDFAQIEAIKTNKGSYKENTYANVIEGSLYANALVSPPKHSHSPIIHANIRAVNEDNAKDSPKLRPNEERIKEEKLPTVIEDLQTCTLAQNMNTLAVNRLLRKLEAAIASGNHQKAAGLAKELARLKIHCSVVRQRSVASTNVTEIVNVNMYIEDKLAHQGPIPLQLPTIMTVAQLKTKVHAEFEIPTNVQRWIIGKNLADNDSSTLHDLQAVEGSPVFLYLVAPELHNDDGSQADKPSSAEQEHLEELDRSHIVELPLKAEPENQNPPQEECTPEETKLERYEELMSLENCDVIPNSEPIECPICFVTYGPREGVIIRDCLHMFCRTCIADTILYCEEAEVRCPYRDTEYTCESTLQEREIKALVLPEIYQQHLAKSIAQAENNAGNNAFHCKTPDCPGWCIYDDNVNNFLCPVCDVNNCLTCQVVHTGKNCREYQEELRLTKETDQESRRTAAMLEEMVDRGEALACPTCAVVLMKKWGCDWLRCSMCKTEICWVTRGPRWGPGGKGDISGGCRCGENGVKCHPRCNYCH